MDKTKKKKRNVIFLDVDGVLNDRSTEDRTPCGFIGLEDSMIVNLARIVEVTGAEIVLTSTWKSEWSKLLKDCEPDGAYLSRRLKKHGLCILDKTEDHVEDRGTGIRKYLDAYPNIENWVVLDDDVFRDYIKCGVMPHLVHTSYYCGGLTAELADRAISILEGGASE